MATVLWIFVTVDVKLLIRRSFDTLKIIGPAKTGPAGPLPTAMLQMVILHFKYSNLPFLANENLFVTAEVLTVVTPFLGAITLDSWGVVPKLEVLARCRNIPDKFNKAI